MNWIQGLVNLTRDDSKAELQAMTNSRDLWKQKAADLEADLNDTSAQLKKRERESQELNRQLATAEFQAASMRSAKALWDVLNSVANTTGAHLADLNGAVESLKAVRREALEAQRRIGEAYEIDQLAKKGVSAN